ncbi:hypothetical protein GW17_00057921 [Ensete ventricosum]|nr:hypothetical protein GW17_00057921 [Ensete ventricosum]
MEVVRFVFGIFGGYGLPFVSPNNLLVSTINGAGSVIEAVYVLIFLVYAPKKERARVAAMFTFVLSVFAVISLVSVLALHGHRRKLFCGFAAAIFSICMYASPLSIMRGVHAVSAVLVRVLVRDIMVRLWLTGTRMIDTSWNVDEDGGWWMMQVPNGCGSALGAMQLILYTIYRNRTTTDGGSETNGQGHKPPEDDSRATEKKPDHRPIADQV